MYQEKEKIETLTGVIDESTGTVTLKAVFPNKNKFLRSGGTGNILIPLYLHSVIVIPQKATTELQDKKFVYTLVDSSIVRRTPIDVLDQDDGKITSLQKVYSKDRK
ncbi:MAG: hypothetical protein LIO65_08615 [Odoribacter sp.]|nr:hypothetical protein [Odoribacter sp.]